MGRGFIGDTILYHIVCHIYSVFSRIFADFLLILGGGTAAAAAMGRGAFSEAVGKEQQAAEVARRQGSAGLKG